MNFEYPIIEHKTHEEAIVYFFEQMNSYIIGHYLTEECYIGFEQVDFFYALVIKHLRISNRSCFFYVHTNCTTSKLLVTDLNDFSYPTYIQ
jgi:hypothetical protein